MMVWISSIWTRANRAASLLRWRPFDTSTPQGRSSERYRRVLFTAIGSGVSRSIALLSTLVTVRVGVRYLGAERYGLWMTISSLVAFLNFADLGISNGLLTAISEANGRDDPALAQDLISSAFLILSGIALLLGVVFALAYPWISWSQVFNVTSARAVAEAGPAITVFTFCFLLGVPLGIVQQAQLGYQEGFINSIWQGSGRLMGLVGILLAISKQADLPWIVLAAMGMPAIAALLNALSLFGFRRPWLRPSLHRVKPVAAKRVLKTGLLFFALQLAGALAYQSPNIVIAQLLGAEQVPQYAVPMQLFMIPLFALSLLSNPLWPAYGEALARHDIGWIRKALVRSILAGLAINGSAAILLVLFGRRIVSLWVGSTVAPSPWLLLGLGIWTVINSLGGPLAALLNGTNIVGFQVICSLLMGASSLLLSLFLVPRMGLVGVVYGNLVAQVVFVYIPSAVYVPRLFRSWAA